MFRDAVNRSVKAQIFIFYFFIFVSFENIDNLFVNCKFILEKKRLKLVHC